jgi:hypothetical protein
MRGFQFSIEYYRDRIDELEAEVERLKAALDDIRHHVRLRTEPSAVSVRQIAEAALKGENNG